MQNLKRTIELVSKKCDLDVSREDKDLMNPYWLLDAIVKEAQEVKEEIKPNNSPYFYRSHRSCVGVYMRD